MEDGLDGATNEEQDAAVKEENKDEDEEDVDFGEEIEEDIVTHQVGKRPLAGKAWRNSSTGDYTKYLCVDYGAGTAFSTHPFCFLRFRLLPNYNLIIRSECFVLIF